jgi:hypothetical protein
MFELPLLPHKMAYGQIGAGLLMCSPQRHNDE